MNFGLKAASMAALGICLMAGSVASSVSLADDTVPAVTVGGSVTPNSSNIIAQNAASAAPVIFSTLSEVVQPLPSTKDQPAPVPEGVTSVPAKSYDSLNSMVADADVDAPLDAETNCLATAVFYEARSESLEGQLAVARVIINRADSSRFATSLCGVVRQPGQFSFVRGGVIPSANAARPAWRTSIAIARIALENAWQSEAEGALYFHARRVSPGWARQRVAVIDNHIFYR
jgi:spore germination cell wall hydrolase CwlJ-like protein